MSAALSRISRKAGMRAFTAVTALFLGLTGCRVLVIGDSNSCMGFAPRQCDPRLWPGILQGRLDDLHALWTVENYGMPGMAVAEAREADGSDRLQGSIGEPIRASFHLERMLAEQDLARICRWLPFQSLAPRLVLAVGTNDVGVRESWRVVEDLVALAKRATAVAPCLRVYVATIPPRFDADFERQQGNIHRILLNGLIRGRFPADRVIDFDAGFTREDIRPDGVHLNESGQAKRADVVMRALFPGLAG
jgi:hypothetical protein